VKSVSLGTYVFVVHRSGKNLITEIPHGITGMKYNFRYDPGEAPFFYTSTVIRKEIVSNVKVVPGYSGSPLLDGSGRLVGVNNATVKSTGDNMLVSLCAKELVKILQEYGKKRDKITQENVVLLRNLSRDLPDCFHMAL